MFYQIVIYFSVFDTFKVPRLATSFTFLFCIKRHHHCDVLGAARCQNMTLWIGDGAAVLAKPSSFWHLNVEVGPTAWHIYRLLNFHQSDHTSTIFKCVFASRLKTDFVTILLET